MNIKEGSEQAIPVSKIMRRGDYIHSSLSNDVALLKLSRPLTFNDDVQPIQLPQSGHNASGLCLVSGWGYTNEHGYGSPVLQKAKVPIVSDESCRMSYGAEEIEDSMVCAGVPEGGVDACFGDSGGPLVCSDTGTTYLTGVVSSGLGCARPGFPGIYAEVSYYVNWIKANAI